MSDLRSQIEDLVYREAELLDDLALTEWLSLFTGDGVYWVPIDPDQPRGQTSALIYDDTLAREERVHHLLNLTFPAQNPRSRTVHCVSNVRLVGEKDGLLEVRSSQVIYETRTGDYTQVGLGELSTYVATVHHQLRLVEGHLRIHRKTVLLIGRDMPLGNLTFIF